MRTVASIILFLAIAPSFISAMTRDEILAEIGRLMIVADTLRAQIRALGVDPSTVTASIQGTPRYDSGRCASFTRTLSTGSTGSDVTALQTLLIQKGLLRASATGYFGSLTANAVAQFQVTRGIVGTGVVDQQTASALALLCGGNSSSDVAPVDRASLSVTPSVGSAPLKVTAVFAINGTTCTSYALDWGDGTSRVTREGGYSSCATDNINRQLVHTYLSRGTYAVTLRTIRGPLSSAPIVQQVQVTVQ